VIESNIEHSENVVTSSSSVSGRSSTTKVQEGPSEHYSSSRCGRSPKTKRNHKTNSNVVEEKSGDKNVKSCQDKSELSSAVIESNIEHSENVVTSSSSVSGRSSTTKVQEGPSEHYSSSRCGRSPKTKRNHKINSEKSLEIKDNNCNKCSSSISDSARMENTKSDKLNKTPAPSLEESIQLETSAQFIKLLAEIQNDLIKLDYIKNYYNQENSSTEEYINSTQSKYFLVQENINHMLISEESLEKITAQNHILNADIGIQSVQANPINQN